MAKIVWALLCDRVIIDRDTNSVSYIDAIERLQARELPSGLPRVNVATLWARESDDDTLQVRFKLFSPSTAKSEVLFTTDELKLNWRQRVHLNLQGATVKEEGEYRIVVDQRSGNRWRKAAELPLMIELEKTAESERSPDSGK
jgi:hypothetical protein